MQRRSEVSYYQEIVSALKEHMTSIFSSKYPNKHLHCYYKTNTGEKEDQATDFNKGLSSLICDYEECECLLDYVTDVPPLLLDIYFVVTDGNKFQIGIVEVKAVNTLGLKECSQLIGYCIASQVEFGILMNVDGGISPPLDKLTRYNSNLTNFHQIVGNKDLYHKIGIMKWNSNTKNFEFFGNGNIRTIEELCDLIAEKF